MSTSGTIADGVVAAITALALDGSPVVLKRKRLILADGDPKQAILVAVADLDRNEPLGDFGTGLVFLNSFGVSVAAVARNSGKIGDTARIREWDEAIGERFRKPGDLPGVNDIKPGTGSVFDKTGVTSLGIDWAEQNFQVEVIF